MKILYAAGNRIGSFYQMKRFLNSIKHKDYIIKLAAYKISSGRNLNIDFTLDVLLNFANANSPKISVDGGNYVYLANEIKRFNPDLIISDMDFYVSNIGIELKIPVWQFSPICLFYGLKHEIKYKLDLHKNYSYLFDFDLRKNAFVKNVLNCSSKKFVLSHVGDTVNFDTLEKSFTWVRPNFILGKGNNKTDYLLTSNNKKIISNLKNNIMLLSNNSYEKYDNIISSNDENIYKSYLECCNYFISDGTSTFAADAFYNQKYNLIFPKYTDIESIITAFTNEYFGLGKIINDIYNIENRSIEIKLNDNIKFISEHLEEFFK
jgi:hypothetical protein